MVGKAWQLEVRWSRPAVLSSGSCGTLRGTAWQRCPLKGHTYPFMVALSDSCCHANSSLCATVARPEAPPAHTAVSDGSCPHSSDLALKSVLLATLGSCF